MTDRNQDLRQWLAAEEADGEWDAADACFAVVASAWLPLAAPPAGLAARVMAALPRPAASPWDRLMAALLASRWVKGTVGAAMLVLGAAAAALALGQGPGIGSVVAALSTVGGWTITAASITWHGFTSFWPLASSLGDAAATVAATRTVAILVLVNLALASGAFAGLTRLLAVGEEK